MRQAGVNPENKLFWKPKYLVLSENIFFRILSIDEPLVRVNTECTSIWSSR